MYKTITIIFLVSVLLSVSAFSQDDSSAEEKYIKAKTFCVKQKWNDAIIQFEDIIEKHSESPYVDDAFFWVGYCLEKIPDMQTQAFMQFDYVVNKFPNSPWNDDAIIHQITLAEELYLAGKTQYHSFLKEFLKSENKDIRNRAALSLGRLNDKSALPILNDLASDEELGIMAKNVISYLGSSDTLQQKNDDISRSQKTLNLLFKSEQTKQKPKSKGKGLFSWLNSLRYEQYKSMLREDNNWSKEELNTFALWHILGDDTFQEFYVLTNEYDKKEWLRKYWKTNDPTPTTEINEKKVEFERRIIYARSYFSAFWNYSHMKYLPDQHLRLGWNHAPWDARGELYIKYGEPDIRSVEGWHTEEWIYYNYKVDFLVKQYMTNIYGNAISGGELSMQRYGNDFFRGRDNSWIPYLQTNFIYKNEMKFVYNYDAEPIEDFKMDITSTESGFTITYTVPSDEFINNQSIRYSEQIVVNNSDQREVTRKSFDRKITELNDEINQIIEIELPAGDYDLAIKIKDENSKKLGIYKSSFQVDKR